MTYVKSPTARMLVNAGDSTFTTTCKFVARKMQKWEVEIPRGNRRTSNNLQLFRKNRQKYSPFSRFRENTCSGPYKLFPN